MTSIIVVNIVDGGKNGDADEVEAWIVEKLKAISDETVKDAANIQVGYYFFFLSNLKLSSIIIFN